ncbi:DUF4330 domain-containing protein [Salinirubellus salinus]|uniref:DUF4330 domain-containing protein n=1 Tax=Salinirubellus salinus TaxID=1364945 RepID=A0A9E7QZ70_9EURY|nr:DUF4330 family protein [Salinirubellus salinus]UWM52739.1 DUF4330 domain-containing protein [Salinirubellus salinus]
MQLLDDDGRLFGIVNVVDALAVLLFVSLLVAGVAVVGGFGSESEPATRYATVELGEQPVYVAQQLSVGDRSSAGPQAGNVTVTDLSVSGASEPGTATVYARVEIEGALAEREDGPGQRFTYADRPLPVGSTLAITGAEYETNGTVVSLDAGGETLNTSTTPVRVETTVPADVAMAVKEGDAYRIDGQALATITDVRVAPTADPSRYRLSLALDIETARVEGSDQFAGRTVSIGTTVPFRTASYNLTGSIVAVGDTGLTTETTAVRIETTVQNSVAASVSVGDTYRVNGGSVGRVVDVRAYPTPDDSRRFLSLGLELETVVRNGERRFGGQTLSLGQSIPFRTTSYDVTGTVVGLGSSVPPGEATTTTVTVDLESVDPAVAAELDAGTAERLGNRTLATVTEVERANATVVLESESGEIFARNHPVLEDVTLTLDLTTRRTDNGLRFHARPLTVGRTVTFDLGTVRVTGNVTSIER